MTLFQQNPELLDPFRDGEREALERVYHAYVDAVEAAARRGFALGNYRLPGARQEADVKDLIQECFVKAFAERTRHAYDGTRPYKPYLLRILRNLMIDRARSAGAWREELTDELDTKEPTPLAEPLTRAPDEEVHWSRMRDAYREYHEELDEEERAFIALRYVDEMSQREIAEEMSTTRRHIRTLDNRIRDGLKRFLQKKKLL